MPLDSTQKKASLNTLYHDRRKEFAQSLYEKEGSLPHRYVLVLTNRCNLRCSFCFQERNYIEGSLTTEDWIKFIDQLPDYAWVTLTGGEPFLFKGFEAIFKHVTEKRSCNIISNGVLMNEKLTALLLERPNFKVLSISVDDIGNKLRDVKPAQWQHAEAMMRHFAEERNRLGSSTILDSKTVVLDQNADTLLDIHVYCMETLNCDTHSFQLLKGSPIQHSDHMFSEASMFLDYEAPVYEKFSMIVNQFEKIRKYNLKAGKKCYVHPNIVDLNSSLPVTEASLSFINEKSFEKKRFHPCKVPWESIHINVDGELFPCMAISMGNVKKTSLDDIVKGEKFVQFRETLKNEGTVGGCNRCGYLLPKTFS